MLWTQKGHELDTFLSKWFDCKEVVFFGFGQICKVHIKEIKKDVVVKYILDNDIEKSNQLYDGIKIIHPSQCEEDIRKYKILVSTHYAEIKEQLEGYGLKEEEDFCSLTKFIVAWYWYNKRKVHLSEVHIALTTKCSLNCNNCNMYIPHYTQDKHQLLQDIKENLDMFFKMVDKVYDFGLLGGEPFLYPYLYETIDYIANNYINRIENLSIITNGTIQPEQKILQLIKKHNIIIRISDYSDQIKYKQKLGQFEKILNKYRITYERNKATKWLDFGFPHKPLNLPNNSLIQHMEECSPVFKGLNDKKFYYCHIVWSAVQCGLFKEDKDDFIDLVDLNPQKDADKMKLIEYYLGYMNKGYVSLCKQCGGCGKDNTNEVIPAIQISKNIDLAYEKGVENEK